MLAEIHKELALGRATYYRSLGTEYDPKIFIDPIRSREIIAEQASDEQAVEEFQDELAGQMGWS